MKYVTCELLLLAEIRTMESTIYKLGLRW